MIGIICAMKVEAENIISHLISVDTESISGIEFVCGKLNNRAVVVAVSGIGKVFAAMCTQSMILRFKPELIINTGVGGTLTDKLHCGDIAVATSVLQHDIDTTPLGDPMGLVSGINKIYFDCDVCASKQLYEIATNKLGINCVRGNVASGDIFINNEKLKNNIKDCFSAISCDMESGAIGQVCHVNSVPFAVIRAISDEADNSSHLSYNEFVELSASNASKILCEYIGG